MEKKRRFHYDAFFKRKVIILAETEGNRAASRALGVPESCVRDWRKQRDRIFNCKATRKGFSGPQRGRFPVLEDSLADYIKELRINQLPVSSDIVKAKALQLARQYNIPRDRFKASRSWIQKFFKRKGFSLRRRTSICQKLPESYEEKLIAFQRFVINLRLSHDYLLGQMGNADQTPIFFDMPSNYTVESTGAKQVRIITSGNEKNRVTAMLCCTADGHKLSPYLIFKRKTVPVNIAFPDNVIVRAQQKGWMDNDLMIDWIDSVWRKRPGASLGVRSMLVLDSFRCHISDRVKEKLAACHTDLVVIPGGMTSQIQPLDVCLNKPMKDRVRAAYNDWLGDQALTPAGRLKRATLEDIARWVLGAWKALPQPMVVRAFKKCGISNALDGTEDDFLWSVDSEKELSDSDSE